MMLPERIRAMVEKRPCVMDTIGGSDSQVICFDDCVLKIEATNEVSNNERRMMSWLEGRLPVPKILAFEEADGVNYLLMTKVSGQMACDRSYLENPKRLLELLADGLYRLRNVDASDCPSDQTLKTRLRQAEARISAGKCRLDAGKLDGFASPEALLKWLMENVPEEKPTFSHGDFCLPNIMGERGRMTGLIDLGSAGIADWDYDVMTCRDSLERNCNGTYGGFKYEDMSADWLFDALGVVPDREKMEYYRRLDALF